MSDIRTALKDDRKWLAKLLVKISFVALVWIVCIRSVWMSDFPLVVRIVVEAVLIYIGTFKYAWLDWEFAHKPVKVTVTLYANPPHKSEEEKS